MASGSEAEPAEVTAAESAAAMLDQVLRGGNDGGQTGNLSLFPILMATVRPLPVAGDVASPPPAQVVLINPRTRSTVVLSGEAADVLMEGSGRSGVPPASTASIEGLVTVEAEELAADQECAVCLDEFGYKQSVKEMPCKHQFHGICVEKWLRVHGSCPVCRFQMPVEERSAGNGNGEPMLVAERNISNGGREEQQTGTRTVQISISIAPIPPTWRS